MNDVKTDDIQALTDQQVTLSIGGKSYQARRANLYDLGVVQRFRRKLEDAKDTANIEVESSLFLLCELIKPFQADLTPEKLTKSIPVDAANDVAKALEQCGFLAPKPPQEAK